MKPLALLFEEDVKEINFDGYYDKETQMFIIGGKDLLIPTNTWTKGGEDADDDYD
jgi:hypothetical protein